MSSVIPVILSGGSGTRLWPKSREAYPKQLHTLYGEHTMIQHTALRMGEFKSLIAVCNESQRFMVADQLSDVCPNQPDIILEPMARNTAPAIAAAARHALSLDEDPILVILPADHLIKDVPAFQSALALAVDKAKQNHVVAFGVVPTHPETGYGYVRSEALADASGAAIKAGAPILEFVEKPNLEKAQKYLAEGNYTWNSGMFVCRAALLLEELKALGANWLVNSNLAIEKAQRDLDFIRLQAQAFGECENISIDYALMEKTQRAWVVPLSAGWSDVGSWDSLWAASDKDAEGNAVVGDAFVEGCTNSLIHSQDRLVAAIGLNDVAIVDSDDAVLVINKSNSQLVKSAVNWLKSTQRKEFVHHRKQYRPWGQQSDLYEDENYQVKHLEIKPGEGISLQMHFHRTEHWVVVKGTAQVECGDVKKLVAENQSVYVPKGEKHRLSNPGKIPLHIIEVRSGGYLAEDDIVRLEDNYGRENK